MKKSNLIRSFCMGVILWITCLTPVWAQSTPVVIASQLDRGDGSRIDYYLEVNNPSKPAEATLLVMIQGSDCNSVTQSTGIKTTRHGLLPQADVLTVEKYGIDANLPYSDIAGAERSDCPKAYLQHDKPTQRVQDLEAVIAHLVQTKGYRKVVALGGSEGTWVANMLTAQSQYINATIAISGGGQWFVDDLLLSVSASSAPRAEKAKSMRGMRTFIQGIKKGPPPKADWRMSDHGYGWWKDALNIDQLAILKRVSTPVLLIQGGMDQNASPRAANKMAQQLQQSGRSNIEYHFYPRFDHSLKDADNVNHMPEVVSDINVWLNKIGITN